ncbi:hypothetical protein CY34DRAFT_803470 [Suillus luteus UH-Slu-Lm8-n1]|uniref:Uncharacterized protein n=1 Tax=Suillus luteus UH-Slu-Lm8-n1 TaxID=930992 RepID=A0A0D0A1B5_9AGAM|nr:hypothetical protein CY34DRAFT_803470 [Suillus luteus UH-Slu-Lm8-n1]
MHLAAIYTSPVIKQALIIARNNGLWEVMLFLPVMISIDGADSAVHTTRLMIKHTEGCFYKRRDLRYILWVSRPTEILQSASAGLFTTGKT